VTKEQLLRTLQKSAWLYAGGLSGVFLGAWLAGVTNSMVPLALGSSASILCTASVVRAIWKKTPIH